MVMSRNHPDIIVLDLHLPVVGGLEFLRLLRARDRRKTPVAIVTGDRLIDDADLAEIRGLGASIRFKPFWIGDLVELAGQLLEPAGRPLRATQLPN
jgi:CheY-like chemotaxis protein